MYYLRKLDCFFSTRNFIVNLCSSMCLFGVFTFILSHLVLVIIYEDLQMPLSNLIFSKHNRIGDPVVSS
ncbi:hypothetical protein H5410_002171 [Solanum commersonii]|uniref:Uncharacterized protein n=1 Tax=Solanum commersonii TaxID=4109 RepID=A0A9J6B149_SOLCO|nr:hypothetical protein H5410_002171 [Solanum commersonii]